MPRAIALRLITDGEGVVRVELVSPGQLGGLRRELFLGEEREHPDALFQITVVGSRRRLGWCGPLLVQCAAPGYEAGGGEARRFLDLAEDRDERALVDALVDQETVRVVWVNEAAEAVYRLDVMERALWQEALEVTRGASAEDLREEYEQLLASGEPKSSLPFYKRRAPTRHRRVAERPPERVPYFAGRSGPIPPSGCAKLAGVRLAAGSRAPDSSPAYWITDQPVREAGRLADELAAEFSQTGVWPLLWKYDEDPQAYLQDGDQLEQVAAVDVEQTLRSGWQRLAENGDEVIAPFGNEFPGLAKPAPMVRQTQPFALASQDRVSARLMLIPCNRPADTIAIIGGLACETPGSGISALLRSWEERLGIIPVAIQPSLATVAVTRPPHDERQGLKAAAEFMAFCAPKRRGPGTLRAVASAMLGQTQHVAGAPMRHHTWPIGWYD